MSSASQDTRISVFYATREMAAEARRRAATAALGSAEHDFYTGVAAAAEAYGRPGRAPAEDPAWLDRQTPSFRDGYLKACSVIAAAAGHPRPHLLLPTFETAPDHGA